MFCHFEPFGFSSSIIKVLSIVWILIFSYAKSPTKQALSNVFY